MPRQIAGANALEEREVLGLEAVGGARRGAARGGERRLDVEPERQVGLQAVLDPGLERAQHALVLAAAGALVGEGRIGEAVAQDDLAALERRRDDALDVVAPRREHEQRLGDAVHRLVQEQLAQRLRERRAARLAGADDALAARAQPLGERRDVGRLAGAVDAFEGDEAARHGALLRWNRFTARL